MMLLKHIFEAHVTESRVMHGPPYLNELIDSYNRRSKYIPDIIF